MTPSPRSRRAFLGDVRFLIGIVLVIVSVAGVWLTVSASRRTTPVLQADRTIVRGEPLSAADFRTVDVGLGGLVDEYLTPQQLGAERVAARTIARGELVPSSAVAAAGSATTTTVVIGSTSALPAGVRQGSVVELWQAPLEEDHRTLAEPRILVAEAVVAAVKAPDGMLASSRTDVEVVIGRAEVAAVLAAINGGAAISLVPSGPAS
ncbi:SAF domain-containing protein [Microbacterium sp.]|uniref:SAF domain-containing protein n=1 Tax=Microbacterium sp. TaxID=51671 RepID=UPI003342C93C